jgi:hypothetical protein
LVLEKPSENWLQKFTLPVFLEITFHKTLELQGKKSGGFAIDEHARGSMNEPVDHSQNRAFCYRLPALYKLFCLLFECSDFSSVFTSYYVIMCNWHRVSSENLVTIQAHLGLNFSFYCNMPKVLNMEFCA